MHGKIIKGIAGFYYIHVEASGIYECKAKGIFRNRHIKPLVGDNVEIEVIDKDNFKGNVVDILPRKNELIRPASANLFTYTITKFALNHKWQIPYSQIEPNIKVNLKFINIQQSTKTLTLFYTNCKLQFN